MKLIIFILIIFITYVILKYYNNICELFTTDNILDVKYRKFPYRYLRDKDNNILNIVALTAFFREDKDKELYYKYINNNINIIGITAYKTFPLKIRDNAEDKYHLYDDFNYTKNIKLWLACMNNIELYNFTTDNILTNISESDFYDVEEYNNVEKKYDFIYICNKDDDYCNSNGWNAINRNYDLALKCFPIMINEYGLKGLCVGRIGCDLVKYKDNITVTDFLPWHELQQKMRESKFLFLPNIYDASPRVIAECLIKYLPVLMNKSIICGFKYINKQTGEFFIDEHDIRNGLDNILNNKNPRKWWSENYSNEISSKKLRDFLYPHYPDILKNINNVYFII